MCRIAYYYFLLNINYVVFIHSICTYESFHEIKLDLDIFTFFYQNVLFVCIFHIIKDIFNYQKNAFPISGISFLSANMKLFFQQFKKIYENVGVTGLRLA